MTAEAANPDADDPLERFTEELSITENRHGNQYAEGSIKRYRRSLELWQEWLTDRDKSLYDDVTTREVKLFLKDLSDRDYSENARKNARSAITLWYRLCTDQTPPTEGLNRTWTTDTKKSAAVDDVVEYLTEEEIQSLIDSVPSPTFRNELICKTLYMTGIRRSELVTLRVEDVNLDTQTLSVWDEKSDTRRTVGFRSALKRPLKLWIDVKREAMHDPENPYLFPSPESRGDHDHLSGETVRKVISEAAERSGLQDEYATDASGRKLHTIGPHTLRHSFVYAAAKEGISAPFVRDQLGHHDISVTDIYMSLSDTDAAEVISKRGPSL